MNKDLIKSALATTGFKGMGEAALTAKNLGDLLLVSGVPLLPYYAEVVIKRPLREVAALYADWALGLNAPPKIRSGRLRLGLSEKITAEEVFPREVNFRGSGRVTYELKSRRTEDGWLLRMRHWGRMSTENQSSGEEKHLQSPVVHWDNMVRLVERPDGLLVQHAIQVTYPPGRNRYKPFPGCPRALRKLLASSDVVSPDLSKPVTTVSHEDADHFLGHVLLDDARRIPYVVMAHRKSEATGQWVLPLDPKALADKLHGIAQVVVLDPPVPRECFTASLVRRGYPKELGIYDGGLRLYMPLMTRQDHQDDHRLWTRFYFERHSPETALNLLLPQVGALIAALRIPTGFFNSVAALDARREDERVRQAEIGPAPVETVVEPVAAVAGGPTAKEIAEMRLWLADLEDENERLTRDNRRLENDVDAERAKVEELDYRLSKIVSKGPDAGQESDAERERVASEVLAGDPSLESSLLFLQHTFPGRMVVLPSALDSARESECFQFRDRAFTLMRKLVTDYWEALVAGKGDVEARGALGDGYAANEAEKGSSNETAVRQRTFSYDGQRLVMNKHLRIGVKDSLSTTWRCHFHWDNTRRKLVIGHCGRHLDFC